MTKNLNGFLQRLCFFIILSALSILAQTAFGQDTTKIVSPKVKLDSSFIDTVDAVTAKQILRKLNGEDLEKKGQSLDIHTNTGLPFISIQQLIKGKMAGAYVQETNGEPGSVQNIVIRGLSAPLFTNKDINAVRPVVYINGIPLVQEHPYAFDIQQYDFDRIGPHSNILAGLDIDNIQSIELIKDPLQLAKLGPLAANGAIWIVAKNAKSGYRQITFNSYLGLVTPPNVEPTNAAYDQQFYQQFFNKYPAEGQSLPLYLRDTSNERYFGSSQWADLYYKAAPLYNANFSFASGSDRANFRFVAGRASDAGNADQTSFSRNNAAFYINMAPFKWLNFSSMVSGTRAGRVRNRNFRDRFGETQYIPEINSPIAPSKASYQSFLDEYDKTIDDNINNAVQGYVSAQLNFKRLKFTTSLMFDYNEGIRDVFWPSTIMQTANYASNYFGYSQRAIFNNKLSYDFNINNSHKLSVEVAGNIQYDTYQYNYAKAYNGPNDYIKINATDGNFIVYRYTDKERLNLLSGSGYFSYKYKNLFQLNGLVRIDGSSNLQKSNRYLIQPAASAKWDLKNHFFPKSKLINGLSGNLSFARIGKLVGSDRISAGPQYTGSMGWAEQPNMPSYNGVTGLSRPYSSGWMGYDVAWPYADKLDLTIDGSFLRNRITTSVSFYHSRDNDMLLNVPVPREYGYSAQILNGLDVQNTGVDLLLEGKIINQSKGLKWTASVNFNFNRNEVVGLPNNLSEVAIGDRLLKVGQPVDRFYVYQNNGIYTSDSQVPVSSSGKKLSFNNIPFRAGDPIWSDLNGDLIINEKDRTLEGNAMPKLAGGFQNTFQYKKFDLSFHLHFAVGQKALNNKAANKFNYLINENLGGMNAVNEIFFWQQDVDLEKYPIYNIWGGIDPYRPAQDLFLEDASYLKLRSVTLGYNFIWSTRESGSKVNHKKNTYIYISGTNLLTLTKFSGLDPELVGFNGYYTGYSLPMPRAITIGMKANF